MDSSFFCGLKFWNSVYKQGSKCKALQKYKDFQGSEFGVIKTELTDKGNLLLTIQNDTNDKIFKLKEKQPKTFVIAAGMVATIRYNGRLSSGLPQHARLADFRIEQDLPK